jgi:hypothetical protein
MLTNLNIKNLLVVARKHHWLGSQTSAVVGSDWLTLSVPVGSDLGSWPNGIKLSSNTPLLNKLRASHGDRVAVSRIGSALNGAG